MACYMINGKVRFDTSLYSIIRDDGVEIRLSKMEVEVFSILCEHAKQTVTRQFIFDHAWPNDTGSDGHLNRVILLLRRKFDSLGLFDVIKTVPKVGYIVSDADSCADVFIGDVELSDDVLVEEDQAIGSSKSGVSIDSENESTLIVNRDGTNPIEKERNSTFINLRYILGVGIVLLSLVLYFKVTTFSTGGTSSVGEKEGKPTSFQVYSFYSNNFISLYSTIKLNDDVQEKIEELVSTNVHNGGGHYYINISKKAISVLHMNNEHRSLDRRIYLRGRRGLVEELGCILNISNNEVNVDNIESVRVGKNSITRKFISSISPSCPINDKQTVVINISATVSSNAADNDNNERNKFFYISMIGSSYDGEQLFSVSTSGYVEYYIDGGVTYAKWNEKTKNINALSQKINDEPEVVTIINDLVNRERPFITRRITDGIYISDILGGVVMSST
ncbi:hypothetical protein Ri1_05920 [Aeromonas dhakensis]|nr:hypothetical protein Ri1_05920 [Aeromonas dhakensis]